MKGIVGFTHPTIPHIYYITPPYTCGDHVRKDERTDAASIRNDRGCMAFHARRGFVLSGRSIKEDAAHCPEGRDPTRTPNAFSLEFLPAVSTFTIGIPARRRIKLPFASIAAGSTLRPRKEKVPSEGRKALSLSKVCIGEVLRLTVLQASREDLLKVNLRDRKQGQQRQETQEKEACRKLHDCICY